MLRNSTLTIERSAGALGAEINGLDLSQDLDGEIVAQIRAALLEHLVVFFRDQTMTPQQLVAFGRRFGMPVEYPFVKGTPEAPEVIEVLKLEHEKVNFGGIWHSDTTYLAEPPMGSMLLAAEVPPFGGDTLFANMFLAYESLSARMRELLDGLTAISSSAKADVSRTREDRIASNPGGGAKTVYEAEHPVVRTHPESGRKGLYVNIAHTVRFGGMTAEESEPLLAFLFRHQTKPEFTCRFRWQPGSLAFWDNRSTQHNPINDYHGYRRRMLRITLAGDRPA
uniref:Putative alpha-ketoglutarate-dependent taurine dioxygenase n=1 Tax=uncultured bacterium 1114 TaxID=548901 RepID=B8R931_9BACT|nr:putative alpha-ketoglutarate-dependent taurine dioxygenase [uncultured bacterium 1114]